MKTALLNPVRILVMFTLALLMSACTINEAGPMGPEGPPGEPGNANLETVYFSFTYGEADIYGDYSEAYVYMPEITPSIVDEGIVLAYHEKEPGLFQALPYTESYTSGFHYGYNFAYQLEEAIFIFESDDADWIPPANRVFAGKSVIIHGPYYLGKLAGVDVNDYRAVEKALDLEAVEADSIVRSVIKAQSRAK